MNVNGDTSIEPDETFFVDLFNATNATITDNQGQGTIGDDDSPIHTFVSTDIPKSIRDLKTVTSTITVSDPFKILEIELQLDISHTRVEDLDVFLISPNGTRVELFTDVGGTGNDFTGTIFDDEVPDSIVDGSAPFIGSFRPEGNLSVLLDENAQGDWTLEITDDTRKQKGTLNSWSLTMTEKPPGVTVTPTSGLVTTEAGGSVTFTVVLDSPPTGTVFVQLIPSDITEGRLQDANSHDQTLEYDEDDWDIEQEVTVIGVDDFIDDDDILYIIEITIFLGTTDSAYIPLDPEDVEIINLDIPHAATFCGSCSV